MSSLIKLFAVNALLHQHDPSLGDGRRHRPPTMIEFTKILTKYSSEYNNTLFLFRMCQSLKLDKKDVYATFAMIRSLFRANTTAKENDEVQFAETHLSLSQLPSTSAPAATASVPPSRPRTSTVSSSPSSLSAASLTKLDIRRFFRFMQQNHGRLAKSSADAMDLEDADDWLDDDADDDEMEEGISDDTNEGGLCKATRCYR
jgi:hypothetical protein